jgi:hypothetical protein
MGRGVLFLVRMFFPLEGQMSLGRRVYLRDKIDIKLNRARVIVKQAGLLLRSDE